jgi:hypothetical protein
MKKVSQMLFLLVFVAGAVPSFAQTFALRAGLNMAKVVTSAGGYSSDTKLNPGFHVGVVGEYPLNPNFAIETGLLLNSKGYRLQNNSSYESKGSTNLLYLDVPVSLKARHAVGGITVYGTAGPYIGMGLSGKLRYETNDYDGTRKGTQKLNWGSDPANADLKRLDYGLTIGGGVEVRSFQVGLVYGLGLANLLPQTKGAGSMGDIKYVMHNRLLSLAFGYRLGQGKK